MGVWVYTVQTSVSTSNVVMIKGRYKAAKHLRLKIRVKVTTKSRLQNVVWFSRIIYLRISRCLLVDGHLAGEHMYMLASYVCNDRV